MKRIFLIFSALAVVILVVTGCGPKKVNVDPIIDPSITQEVAPVERSSSTGAVPAPTAASREEDARSINCSSDRNCFVSRFLKCLPAEFELISLEGLFQISVTGLVGDRCYYQSGLYKEGVLINSGFECRVPLTQITNDTFNHFFGQDQAEGKESIKIEQDRIQADFCNSI